MTPNPQAEQVAAPLHEELRLEASRVSVIDNRLAGRLMRMAEDAERMADRLTAAIDAMRKGWMPIESCPAGEVLLYWPATKPARGRSGNTLQAMVRVDRKGCTPFREPTHWAPIPPPPEKQA